MDRCTSVDELEKWASARGLQNDEMVNLRRIELLAERVTNQPDDNKCDVCFKVFKHRKDLLRHKRTVHSGTDKHQCSVCNAVFSRRDAYHRHIKSHDKRNCRKRKAFNDENKPGNCKKARLDAVPQTLSVAISNDEARCQNKGKCNWCTQEKQLLPGKKFCHSCSQQGRECKWCHRPLPERFFSKRTDVCDRCITRRENWITRQQHGGGHVNALEGTAQTEIIEPNPGNLWDILQFFVDNRIVIENSLIDRLASFKGMKWFMTLHVKFVKYNQSNEAVYAEPTFRSINFTCTNASQIKEQMAEAFQNLHNAYQNFERDGSGWSIDKILKLELNTVEYVPLQGSSYLPLPRKIQKKKAVLNVKNSDQKCFLWTVLASVHSVSRSDNPNAVSHYLQYENQLKTDMLDFPTSVSSIAEFEKRNKISVNVFGLEKDEVYPLQITKFRDMPHHVNLLLFSKGEIRHYCLIRNLNRLLSDRTLHKAQSFFCNYCLHGFVSRSLLEEHIPYCSPNGPQKLSFPKTEEQQWVYFNHIHKQLDVPFVIYADLESFVEPVSTCEPDPSKSSTNAYQKHEPSGFCYLVKCTSNELSKPARVYRGPNVIDNFFKYLFEEEQNICEILSKFEPLKLSAAEEKSFQKATLCHICEKELGADKVRDHMHLPPYTYRGAAHAHCNLQFQFRQGKRSQSSKFYIPIVFHNLRGYDSHLLMESAGKMCKGKKLTVIPNHSEKYLSFSVGNLRFIDSLQFLNESLEKLVTNLSKEDASKFEVLASHFPDEDQFQLLLRKGVYPYDFVSLSAIFNETSLPPKYEFYNKLSDTDISDTDYEHAQTVWNTFQMTDFGQYHDLYLKTDVILLADVFENFRKMCQTYYKIDPAHYYSSPGFAWEAMLKMTGAKLQLLDDIDMVLMIEGAMRGGISMVTKKYAKANNPLVPGYDPSRENTWLVYWDMNNLYGCAQSEALPEKDFYWLNEDEIEQLDIMNLPDDSETGLILEVDLEYPSYLHETDNDYPMAVEALKVTKDMLSPYTLELGKILKLKHKDSTKLVPNLYPKEHYVLHYRNLKQYLSHGLQLKKIHRAIGFTQSPWLKSYIDFNTEKRKNAQNSFEKDFFKLMNNSVFGKTMENMRKRVHVELVNTPKRLRKLCAKPNFQSFKIFNEDLVAVNLKKVNIVLNRPIYAGFCILDISKTFMYAFHYEYMQAKYGPKARLLFTDTDSLCYEVEVQDIYEEMYKNKHLFDLSNYDKTHYLFDNTNNKVLRKMKDECGGSVVEEFVGLRPKMYSLKYGSQEKKTAKGVKKCVMEKQLKHEAYRACLENKTEMRHEMNMIRSYSHQVYSITVNKTSLSPYDDKRHVLKNGIESLAYGHKRILES